MTPVTPAGGRGRGVRGLEGEASGLRPAVLQDHGRADARHGPVHEEDSQAAAHLLPIQKLRREEEQKTTRKVKTRRLDAK